MVSPEGHWSIAECLGLSHGTACASTWVSPVSQTKTGNVD